MGVKKRPSRIQRGKVGKGTTALTNSSGVATFYIVGTKHAPVPVRCQHLKGYRCRLQPLPQPTSPTSSVFRHYDYERNSPNPHRPAQTGSRRSGSVEPVHFSLVRQCASRRLFPARQATGISPNQNASKFFPSAIARTSSCREGREQHLSSPWRGNGVLPRPTGCQKRPTQLICGIMIIPPVRKTPIPGVATLINRDMVTAFTEVRRSSQARFKVLVFLAELTSELKPTTISTEPCVLDGRQTDVFDCWISDRRRSCSALHA